MFLTLFVSTPPYFARTLGSWIVSRFVPVTVITVLPLRTHTHTHTHKQKLQAKTLTGSKIPYHTWKTDLLEYGPVRFDAGDGWIFSVNVFRVKTRHLGSVNHQTNGGGARARQGGGGDADYFPVTSSEADRKNMVSGIYFKDFFFL